MALVERMAKDAKVSIGYLQLVVRTASRRYKVYEIPKRSGGARKIEQPSREIKYLQRWLVRHVFSHFSVHNAAKAYREGVGIRDNALIHLENNFLLKLDFENFFPSIKRGELLLFFKNNVDKLSSVGIDDKDIEVILDLVCRNGALTIGSPSSPILSNIIMFDIDRKIYSICANYGVSYSRYADDLTFSTNIPNVLDIIVQEVRNLVASENCPVLKLNEKKSVFTSKKRKRIVTGIYLTSDDKLSVGRDKKRQIKSMLYRMMMGSLTDMETSYLSGYLSFANYVEPDFLMRLRAKFGDDAVNAAFRSDLEPRKGLGPL